MAGSSPGHGVVEDGRALRCGTHEHDDEGTDGVDCIPVDDVERGLASWSEPASVPTYVDLPTAPPAAINRTNLGHQRPSTLSAYSVPLEDMSAAQQSIMLQDQIYTERFGAFFGDLDPVQQRPLPPDDATAVCSSGHKTRARTMFWLGLRGYISHLLFLFPVFTSSPFTLILFRFTALFFPLIRGALFTVWPEYPVNVAERETITLGGGERRQAQRRQGPSFRAVELKWARRCRVALVCWAVVIFTVVLSCIFRRILRSPH